LNHEWHECTNDTNARMTLMHVESIRAIRKPVVSKAEPFDAIRDSDQAHDLGPAAGKANQKVLP